MPQKTTPTARKLTRAQLAALEGLLQGKTVTAAAEGAGVARETVHRWKRQDWAFQAALNRGQRELHEAVHARLLAVAVAASGNVASAIEHGDLRASIVLLKGLGSLAGTPPATGSEDPETLRGEAQIATHEVKIDLLTRSLGSGFRTSSLGEPVE
jgi:hypothetical protein